MKHLFRQRDGVFEADTISKVETYTQASNGYPLFQICHLYSICILLNATSFLKNPDVAVAFFAAVEQNCGFA